MAEGGVQLGEALQVRPSERDMECEPPVEVGVGVPVSDKCGLPEGVAVLVSESLA